MKIPESIWINNFEVKITLLDDKNHVFKSGDWGQFSAIDQEIQIATADASVTNNLDTLWHEIVHAGLHYQHLSDQIGEEIDELVATNLGSFLANLCLDNPEFITFLYELNKELED